MLCRNPIMPKGSVNQYVACGRCLPCRVGKASVWSSRIRLEATQHEHNSFVTLTYDEEHNPGQLDPNHLQLFLKRFRKSYEPLRVRFYAVGEYGEGTKRPHYHAILFGHGGCYWLDGKCLIRGRECSNCNRVRTTWGLGHTSCLPYDARSAKYVSGYVVKKMKDDLNPTGLYPAFSRMSRRPGIGAWTAVGIAKALDDSFQTYSMDDVPTHVRINGEKLPIGKYIREKVRENLWGDKVTPAKARALWNERMLLMQMEGRRMGISPREVLLQAGEQGARTKEFFETLKKRNKI